MKWLGMAVAAEEVAMEGPVAVVAEAVVAGGAVPTPPLWVQDVDGKTQHIMLRRFLLHVSPRLSQNSVLHDTHNSGGFFG